MNDRSAGRPTRPEGRDPDRRSGDPVARRPRDTRSAEGRPRSARDSGSAEGGGSGGRQPGKRTGSDAAGAGAADATPRVRPSGPGSWDVGEQSLLSTVLGVNPLVAVGVAALFTGAGVLVDLVRVGTLGTIFTVCYLAGCVLGVAWVRRNALFWPMVVPPLLMAAAVPIVVLVAGSPRPGAGIAQRMLQIGAPLVNGFPMMAWTTGLAVALGLFRLVTQRRPKGGVRSAPAAARGAARRSGSPRRS